MTTRADNERMTRIDGDAPMGRLMRDHYWIPFAMSAHLVAGDGPMPVRLFGENYVAFRDAEGRIGFLDELCPHRRSSLVLARNEGNGVRCIYHGWKIDAAGCVVDCPTQVTRKEQFMASVSVMHFPVRECGGLAWVWLGRGDIPPFPELPFGGEHLYRSWCVSRIPCNWLQGMEGSIDSSHQGQLHQTWIRAAAQRPENANLTISVGLPPRYETENTPYGMRAAAIRTTADGGAYARVSETLLPFVTLTPTGRGEPDAGAVFVISPVDDTHHLLFFGTYAQSPDGARSQHENNVAAADFVPEPFDFAGLRGDRSNRWGQDRDLIGAGHFTGFGRSLLEEDAAVQASMGAILDRTREHLTSGDVAVAGFRRILLDACAAVDAGRLPPGSARSTDPVHLPNCVEVVLEDGRRWEDAAVTPAVARPTPVAQHDASTGRDPWPRT